MSIVEKSFVCVAGTVIIVFFILGLFAIIFDMDSFADDYPKISFSDFQKWYALVPQKWDCDWNCWNRVQRVDIRGFYRFGFLDGLRFKRWKKKRKKMRERKQEVESVARLLETIQKDIDTCREKAQRELDEATRVTRRVSENSDAYAPIKEWLKLYNSIHKC